MTDPTPSGSPVELIAEALRQHEYDAEWGICDCSWVSDAQTSAYDQWVQHAAAAIEAAVRSWPAPTQARLIDGRVEEADWIDERVNFDGSPTTRVTSRRTRVVGPYRPAQLIGDTE